MVFCNYDIDMYHVPGLVDLFAFDLQMYFTFFHDKAKSAYWGDNPIIKMEI